MAWLPVIPILGADQDGEFVRMIGLGVIIFLSIVASIGNKLREKAQERGRDQKGGRPPRPAPQGEEPLRMQVPIRQEPGVPPRRRPPLRATPPRVTPPDQAVAGQSPRPTVQTPRRVPPTGSPPVRQQEMPPRVRPGPVRVPAPAPRGVQAARGPGSLPSRELGTGAVRAATLIAEHARRSVEEHAEAAATKLARGKRIRDARLAHPESEVPMQDRPADADGVKLVKGPLSRNDLRRAVVLLEILGPPVGERGAVQ